MSTNVARQQESIASEPTITGPFPEPNAYGDTTGEFYYECGSSWLDGCEEWHREGCARREQ